MRDLRLNIGPKAGASLDQFVYVLANCRMERQAVRKTIMDSLRCRIADAQGFPPGATRDSRFKSDVRWFECAPAFLVLAAVQPKTIGKRWWIFPEVVSNVTIVDFNFSPGLFLRKL